MGAGTGDVPERPAHAQAVVASRLLLVKAGALAGLIGPVLFMVVTVLQSLIRPDHDLITLSVSALSVGPYGWVQDVNFIVFGAFLFLFAPALHATLPAARTGLLGPGLVTVMGLGFVVSGLLPALDKTGAFSQDEIGHAVGVWLMTIGAAFAPIVMASSAKNDPEWHGLATYSRWTGISIIVLAFGFVVVSRPPGSALYGQRGLYVGTMLLVLTAWLLAVAWRARGVANDLAIRFDPTN